MKTEIDPNEKATSREKKLQYYKDYVKAHHEEKKAYYREYYRTHKAKRREYLEANAESIALKQKAYHDLHRKELAEKKKIYKTAHREDIKRYTRDKINNYLADGFKWEEVEGFDGWTTKTEVHHRWEDLGYSRKRLIQMDHYYNCEPWELICMTKSEHAKHHMVWKKR